jgi:uncharacterized protein YbaR (Trm112 family)/virulence-associated protein VagC
MTFGVEPHRWMLKRDGTRLIIEPKGQKGKDWQLFGNAFHDAWLNNRDFHSFYYSDMGRDLFEIWYEYEDGRIDFEMDLEHTVGVEHPDQRDSPVALDSNVNLSQVHFEYMPHKERAMREVRSLLSGAIRAMYSPKQVDLLSLLACPICEGNISIVGDSFKCSDCARCYPMRGNIPILTENAAVLIQGAATTE